MKKNKRQIGFLRAISEENTGAENDDAHVNSTPDVVSAVIETLFIPAQTVQDADDLLTTTDILQSVSQNCDTDKSNIFVLLKEAGFKSESIDNTLYWLVKNPV